MTQEDILRMAREAGCRFADEGHPLLANHGEWQRRLFQRFATLVAAAQREKLAHWMRSMGYATGHGDTMEDLLDHLGTQISEKLEAEVLMEREACAKVCEGIGDGNKWSDAHDCAAAIRARSKT
jgi:CelD/BcsL family acetyltransferase involved in cellulose biosynthesis